MKKDYFIDAEELFKRFPKAIKLYRKIMRRSLTRTGKLSLVSYDYATVYEFFDSQNIIIEIHAENEKGPLSFYYKIYFLNSQPVPSVLHAIDSGNWTRPQAEQEAFESAFRILNKKL